MIGQDSSTRNSRIRWSACQDMIVHRASFSNNKQWTCSDRVRVTYVLITNKFSFGNTMSG